MRKNRVFIAIDKGQKRRLNIELEQKGNLMERKKRVFITRYGTREVAKH